MSESLKLNSDDTEPFVKDEYGLDKGNARSTYFPGWTMHILAEGQTPSFVPLFRVHVDSKEELELARTVQPSIVEADFYLCGEKVEV